jgi:hypothetical protein
MGGLFMRVAWFSAVAALIILFAVGPVPGQSNDLSGTWTGNTEVPNSPDPNQVTLTLKKDGDVYKGTISDSMGMVNEAVLQKVKFEDNTLSFEFAVQVGEQNIMVATSLKYADGKLMGSWMTLNGDAGSLELQRKK